MCVRGVSSQESEGHIYVLGVYQARKVSGHIYVLGVYKARKLSGHIYVC